jgi:uncharacterized protein YdaU (DUF1376 family)
MLIMNYWQRGKPLPADDERLARIARVSGTEWASIRGTVSEFFIRGENLWEHARIETELSKVREKSTKARAAGQRSAIVRSTSVQQTFNERSTDAEQTLNHTDTDTDTERKKEISLPSEARPKPVRTPKARKAYPDDFETFWRAYPTDPNMSKAEALAAWQGLGEEDRQQAVASIPSFVAFCRKDPTYRPIHACRFLTKRRFEGHATGPPVQTMVYTKPRPRILTDAEIEAMMLAQEAEDDARDNGGELPSGSLDQRKVASA